MSNIVLRVENLSKQYRLGVMGSGTLRDDIGRWWARVRGKEDPTLKVGETNTLDTVDGDYVWALQDINFEVKQGEVLGIIGKNGAGKSTLLKILSKVTGPTTGQIKAKGRIASLLEVGTGMHPELTGRENIFLNGAILGMTKAEIRRKLDEIIDFAGIAKYVDTPVKRYSSGMRVRLGFAVAAFLEPEILIVDEVLAVGDAEFQKKAIGKMKDVSQGEGRTVLFVSHNMQSVRALCTSALLMQEGKVIYNDIVERVVEKYLSSDISVASTAQISFPTIDSKPFQVLSALTKDAKNNVRDAFDCEEDIYLELECISRSPLQKLYGYLTICKPDASVIWESDSLDSGKNLFNSLSPGNYTFYIKIPKRTLGAGDYVFYMNFASPSYTKFDVDSPKYFLSFQINDSFTGRGNRRNGYFSTILEWKKIVN